jgi:hypothetical protein
LLSMHWPLIVLRLAISIDLVNPWWRLACTVVD